MEGQTSSLRRREPPLHSPGVSTVPATGEYIAGATGNVVDVVEVADSDGNEATTNVSVTSTMPPPPSGCSAATGDTSPALVLAAIFLLLSARRRANQ